ncbi:FtsJ-like methyltransferase-domain-containing protein [Umbelopsis sp. AD052]|nr:FtsJ-like methyltransferase-domain-containing protein [Umbelopsis sp. AD052]
MSYNPKRQRNDGPYQQQGEPYQRHNEGYPRHERQRDSYGRGDQRREPYQRPDERSHRFEHDRHHGSDRRDEPYHRPDQQYRPREDPYHRDERHPSDRRDDWHHRDERYPSDRRDEPYHRDERHPSDRRDDSYHRSEQQHRPREEQYERHGYPSHDDPHRRSEQHYRPRDEHQPREDSHRQDTKHPELSSQVLPPPAKAIEVDFKMNTDFLVCGEDDATVKLSTEEEIVKCLKIKFGGIDEPVDYEFVSSADLVQQVNAVKNRLSGTQHEVFTLARSRTNPFDQIDRANFMNRAATKLAVLDVTFNLMSVSDSSQIFRFADLCGGPGGFSEYLLWRAHTSGQRIHGYGITLKGEADKEWRLNNFHPDANVQESFTVIDGQDHTGDICNPENMAAFAAEVRQESPSGVDLVVADGGICFEGKQDKQEQIAQQLLVCQIATMLASLRKGGKFVCKFFDITQEFTAGLVWILYQCFESICITKPLTSRPANAERYIICDKLRFNRPQAIIDYLLSVNQAIKDEQTKRVCGVVELATLKRDESFIDYLKMRNMIFAIKQKEALERVEEFVQQPHNGAMEPDQSQVRRRCLREWRLPLQKEN